MALQLSVREKSHTQVGDATEGRPCELRTHVVLAAGMVPFVLTTLYRALAGDFVRHARLARWTLPVWLYVSVSGVAVYWMLYRW